MSYTEQGTILLKVDDTQASAKWEQNRQSISRIKKELEDLATSGAKGSEGYKKLQLELKGLTDEQRSLKMNIDVSSASVDQLKEALRYWTSQANKAQKGSSEWVSATAKIAEIRPHLTQATTELNSLGNVVKAQPSIWANFKTVALGVFAGQGLIGLVQGAITGLKSFGMSIYDMTAKFEKYETVLRTVLGSQKLATEAMAMLKKFASETPFSLDQLTGSYIKLVQRGIKVTAVELTKLGDLASSQGKEFDMLTEALLDAGTGEFERLKEFGIKGKTMGDQITLTFGKVQKVIANTPEAIQNAVISFGELNGVMGGMANISKDLAGKQSNLGDTFDDLRVRIGNKLKPVFHWFLDALSQSIGLVVSLGRVVLEGGRFIAEVSPAIAGFAVAILTMNAANIKAAASALYHTTIEKGRAVYIALSASAMRAFNLVMAATPLGAIGLLIASAAAALVYFYNKSESAQAAVRGLWNALKAIGTTIVTVIKAIASLDFSSVASAFSNAGKNIGAAYEKGYNEKTAEFAKSRRDKELAAQKAHLMQLEDNKVAAIKNEDQREKARMDLAYKRKVEEINSTIKDATVRDQKLAQLAIQHEGEISNIGRAARDKRKQEQEEAAKKFKEAEKERLKDEEELLKQIGNAKIEAIKDDNERQLAKLKLDFERDKDAVEKSKANAQIKAEALKQLQLAYDTSLLNMQEDFQKKKEKIELDAIKKKEAEDKKKADEEKARLDQERKDHKELLDDKFKAEIDQAKINLDLTKKNSQAMWDAKLRILNIEAKQKADRLKAEAKAERDRIKESLDAQTEKFRKEADLEKQRIAESVTDKTARDQQIKKIDDDTQLAIFNSNTTAALRLKALDDRLVNELRLNDTSLQRDKINLNQEANDAKEQSNQEFYQGLNAAMAGDMQSFLGFLKKKALEDGKHLNERTQAFANHANGVGSLMLNAVNQLMQLNANYTKSQLNNLTSERDANLKKLDEEYEAGVLTKDELDTAKLKLQKKFDEDALKLKKEEFERNKTLQKANAIIAGSMAILSALAMPWPVGLVMAVLAGVKTAYEINQISNQKFEGRKGGVFKNAGVAQGSSHGKKYGEAGIVMHDRVTGAEVGEIEGGEPVMVLSKKTYANNKPVIDRLLESSMYRNGSPITMQDGGVFQLGRTRMMFADGGVFSRPTGVMPNESSESYINENKELQIEANRFLSGIFKHIIELQNTNQAQKDILEDILEKDSAAEIMHAIERSQSTTIKSRF